MAEEDGHGYFEEEKVAERVGEYEGEDGAEAPVDLHRVPELVPGTQPTPQHSSGGEEE